jgi:hypothetical protein
MATIVNGTSMKIYADLPNDAAAAALGSVGLVGVATTCTLSITIDTPETSSKGSYVSGTFYGENDRKDFTGLSTSWTVEAEMFYAEGQTDKEFLDFFRTAYGSSTTDSDIGLANYPRTCYVKFDCSGDNYHGLAYITALSVTGGTEDASTYSVSLQGTGALTKA